jgi:hypothetical protein
LDKYYFSDGFIVSNVYYGYSLKDDEIVVALDYEEFCLDNEILYCIKDDIRMNLLGKYFIYEGRENYYFRIKDIIEGNNQIYVSDISVFEKLFNEEFEEYYKKYYIVIKNEKLDSFYHKINHNSSLLGYDFISYLARRSHLLHQVHSGRMVKEKTGQRS